MSRDFTDQTDGANGLRDPDGHGTHVAGIIGAEGDNDNGVCGVCWNVQLVSLRVLDASGRGYPSDVAEAITYAETHGIKILNLSAGWHGDSLVRYDVPLKETIENYSGLFVCSAGNDSANNDVTAYYPCNYSLPNLIAVGASTENNQMCDFSNYGKTTVDLFAPGENIYSTIPNNSYGNLPGTSMVSPYVAGIAALTLSMHPDLSGAELKEILMDSVNHVYSNGSSVFANLCVSGGKINAYKAVTSDLLHSYSVSNSSAAGHSCTHSSCDYVQSHDYTASKYSTQKHKLTCSYCGYYVYELHKWKAGGTVCLVCGFNSDGSTVLRTEAVSAAQTCSVYK